MLAPEYEVDVTTHNGFMAHFTCIHYHASVTQIFKKLTTENNLFIVVVIV